VSRGRPRRWARAGRLLFRRRRWLTAAVSVATHLAVFMALVLPRPEAPAPAEPRLMSVVLIQPPPEVEPAPVIAPEAPSPVEPPRQKTIFRETPRPPPNIAPQAAGHDETPRPGVEVSEAQLAGAATAGSGGAGGACNMPRRLQNALRKDPLVRAAVAGADGKAMIVWNGDWVRHPGQDGEGLAAVREAMMWEIGFAPEACRSEPVHGLVLLSLNDGPGSARLVVGQATWRWTDLLFSRSAGAAAAR
jgi:hypothetical protein